MPARDAQLFATLEGTPGTAIAVAGAAALDFKRAERTLQGSGPLVREVVRAHLDRLAPLRPASCYWDWEIELEVKAATAAGTAPEIDTMMKAAGFTETITGGVSAAYVLTDDPLTNPASVTIQLEETTDGLAYVSYGARFGLELSQAQNQQIMAVFRGPGAYQTPTNISSLTSPTYDAGVPLAVLDVPANGPFRFHTYDMIVRSWRVSSGITPEVRPHLANSTDWFYKWPSVLTRNKGRDHVNGEVEIEAVDRSVFDLWAKYEAATAADSQIIAVAGSRKLQIDLRSVVWGPPKPVSEDLNLYRIPFTASRNGSSAAMACTWT